ncbi:MULTISPECIES: hypothetical protein [Pseudoalteromonas]|uniref:DNA gyrase subunit B n=1 Tax=Pseudoalteromonas obscura TaxID=3048491 RepID=A0ABT7EU26_9GAMM|nr:MULTISPECIES: hypothetical protein [Pseudoalteromonas]MBQ4839054.1 hypothetical protein [Pseudoalteromonas luteoviolacea]MDK2598490.1 hypothetical protein [Pseudoalteromonas sp. P94(2023)]
MKVFVGIILAIVTLGYPIIVYQGLKHFDFQALALFLASVLTVKLVLQRRATSKVFNYILGVGISFLVLSSVLNLQVGMLLYPVVINACMLFVFGASLKWKPCIIERLARIREPDLPPKGVQYTEKVTKVWCAFFVINMLVSLYTALLAPIEVWTLYNGLIAYIAMGLLFLGEWLVRIKVRKHHE